MKKYLIAALVVAVLATGIGVWYFVFQGQDSLDVSTSKIDTSKFKGGQVQDTPDGDWTVSQQKDVFAGYEIKELFGGDTIKKTAVGKSSEVTGTFTLEGKDLSAGKISVDTTALKSDSSQRDNRIRTDALQTDLFTKAIFTQTDTVSLSSVEKGKEISLNIPGKLSLHGVSKDVDFPVKAKWDGRTITLSGDLQIALSSFDIQRIKSSFVTIDDVGKIKLQLLFVPAK